MIRVTDLAASVNAVRLVSVHATTIDDGLVFTWYLDKGPAGGYYLQAPRPMLDIADRLPVQHY